jgi:hypothetical protein
MAATRGQYDLNTGFMCRAQSGNITRRHLKILVSQGAVNVQGQ